MIRGDERADNYSCKAELEDNLSLLTEHFRGKLERNYLYSISDTFETEQITH